MSKYILGMAKSPLQVNKGDFGGIADDFIKPISSGPSRSLELDFLRLVYAALALRAEDHEVHAYLMVTTELIQEKVKGWRDKYEVDENLVNILNANLNQDEIEQLVHEKTINRESNSSSNQDKQVRARADKGRGIIEGKLKAYIEKEHGQGLLNQKVNNMRFQINWDYCSIL